ncbi:hypothetical protein VVR12_07415 [Rothia sp. LK2588]|uniref:hypothetical protein n=1 Tax=Rothia sp. LK2588 TaxID=3114369 RepID=UPI0034CFA6C1
MTSATKERWRPGTTLRFLLIASLLNRIGVTGNPRRLLKAVIIPAVLAAWLILAVTLAILLPQWGLMLRRSFPSVPGLPGFTGEYYLLIFTLVPIWLDSMTRASAVLFGASSFQKFQVPTATLNLLGIDRKAYFWHAHQVISGIKLAFCVLPLISVVIWAGDNAPTVALGLALLGCYVALIALEAVASFHRASYTETRIGTNPWLTLAKVTAAIGLGYLTAHAVLTVLAALNIGMPTSSINPHVAAGVTFLGQRGVATSVAAIGLLSALVGYAYILRSPRTATGLYAPTRKRKANAADSGIFFPVVGTQYFLCIYGARAGLVTFFAAGALWALGGTLHVPESLRTAVAIACISFVVGSTFEQTLPLSFSRSRERYRFMYEVGAPITELAPKIVLGVIGSALPGLTVATAALLLAETPASDALIVVSGPIWGLLLSDSFLSTRVRAEGFRFTFIALAQMVVSLMLYAATLAPFVITLVVFLGVGVATVLAIRKAILCMN